MSHDRVSLNEFGIVREIYCHREGILPMKSSFSHSSLASMPYNLHISPIIPARKMSGAAPKDFFCGSHSTTISEETTTAPLPVPEESEELPMQLLKRTLSTRSVISIKSSFTARMQQAALRSGLRREGLRVIGLGSCGSVFEIPKTELAFKKGTSAPAIWRDFCLTNKVHNAVQDVRMMMQKTFPDSSVPKTPLCHDYRPVDDEEFWSDNLERFPTSHRTKQPLFTVDRIFPLPQETRESLINMYFDEDEEIQQEAKDDPDNKDCLVRIYLGERESIRQQSESYDTLRNFPLRLNMMEDLEIEVSQLSKEMAIGLAIMHWQAQVDGMDVEFVLGSSATWDGEQPKGYDKAAKGINFERRALHLWMFDFDKATQIELTKHDVDTKLVPAFLGNDPYYPRPQVDEELWEEFCGFYLEASEVILRRKGVDEGARGLPRRFLDEVVRVSREHEDWNEEDNIVFAA